jgi:hypothetical protein
VTSSLISTAYGAPAFDVLGGVVAQAKAADPMAPVTLLVPNNIAGVAARRFLAGYRDGDRHGIAGLHVTTLARLAEQLAAPTLAALGRRPVTRPVTSAAWRAELGAEPGCFSKVADHPATIRALSNASAELRDLSDEALDAVAASTTLAPDLVRLHRGVVERLHDGWYDTTDVLRTAVNLIAERPERLIELGRCVLWQPQSLTRAEAGLAAVLAKHGELTVIAALTGVGRADGAVCRSLNRLGLPHPGMGPRPPIATEVLHASDADDEVRCVIRDVVTTLASTPAHRVAVLYSKSQPYARLLHEHLGAAGTAVNGPGVRAVHERAVARCLLEVLALGPSDMPRGDLFRALAEAPTRDFTGGLVPVARWERISRSAGVVSGDDWRQRLDRYIAAERAAVSAEPGREDPSRGQLERAERNATAATALRDFATALRSRLAEGQSLTTWEQLSRWARELFTDLLGDDAALSTLPPEEQYAAVAVRRTLAGLTTLDATGSPASYAVLRDVVGIELEGALPRVGRFGDGVLVAPLSAAVGLDADAVYALGLAEDLYPGRQHADALLPDHARAVAGEELPAARERLDAKQRHLLAAFAAGARVVASFPRGDLRRSSSRLPSQWLLWSFREHTGLGDLAATQWESVDGSWLIPSESYASSLRATGQPVTEQEWRTKAMDAGLPLAGPVVDAAVAMIRARTGTELTRYDGNLAAVAGIPDYTVNETAVSPTALEQYAECPHAFFVKRLLGVEPAEDPEELVTMSPLDLGNLIHESFEALVVEYADRLPSFGEEWTPEQKRRLAEIADARARDYEAAGLTGHPRMWQRERILIGADLAWMLDDDFA